MTNEILKNEIEKRYELKMVLNNEQMEQALQILGSLPQKLIQPYPSRSVHSLYLDTFDQNSFRDHVQGVGERKKFRYRWYNQDRSQMYFEIKKKQGRITSKMRWDLKKNELDTEFTVQEMIGTMEPVLVNCYQRDYFILEGSSIRITCDQKIGYQKYESSLLNNFDFTDYQVLEIKSPIGEEGALQDVLSKLPFRPTRHSKYVVGRLATS